MYTRENIEQFLRPGNIVGTTHVPYQNHSLQIVTFLRERVAVVAIERSKLYCEMRFEPEVITPLPLTEVRMDKLLWFRIFDTWVNNEIRLRPVEEGYHIWKGKKEPENPAVIKYVHELQNFYKDNTGEELFLPFMQSLMPKKPADLH
jgi:hypothetical protein